MSHFEQGFFAVCVDDRLGDCLGSCMWVLEVSMGLPGFVGVTRRHTESADGR